MTHSAALSKFRVLCCLLLWLLAGGGVHAAEPAAAKPGADTIIFTNGDRLTGKVVGEGGGKVTFHSDVAGDITVAWSSIRELDTEGSFAVIREGERLKLGHAAPQVPVGTVSASADQVSVATTGGEVKTVPTANAAYIVPADEFTQALLHEPSLLHGYSGALTLGVTLVQATQTSQTLPER